MSGQINSAKKLDFLGSDLLYVNSNVTELIRLPSTSSTIWLIFYDTNFLFCLFMFQRQCLTLFDFQPRWFWFWFLERSWFTCSVHLSNTENIEKGLLSEIPLFGIGLKTVFIVVCYITRRAKNIQTEWFIPVKVFLRKEYHTYRFKRIIQNYTFYSLDINRDISNVLFHVEKSFVNPFDTSFSCDLDHLWILSPFFVAVLCNSFNIRVEL